MKKWPSTITDSITLTKGVPYFQTKLCFPLRDAVKNYLADFFRLGGSPPPGTPLTGNHFAKKPLAERGGTPPSFNGKSPKIFLKKCVKEG